MGDQLEIEGNVNNMVPCMSEKAKLKNTNALLNQQFSIYHQSLAATVVVSI